MESSTIAKVAMGVVLFVIFGVMKHLFWKIIGGLLFGLVVSLFCRLFFDLDDATTMLIGGCVWFFSFVALMRTASDTVDALIDES